MPTVTVNISSTKGFRVEDKINLPNTIEPYSLYKEIAKLIKKYTTITVDNKPPYEILVFIDNVDLMIYMIDNKEINVDDSSVIDVILIRYGG